jgi:T4 gene Gp59 loader of gp41 DNA helicase/T4 gene Gp59 loader of gp41 DNA helicase C-term
MDALDAFKTYVSLKRHFTSDSYDYIKYNGKINVTYDSFIKRNDKIFFAKLGKRKGEYLVDFLVSNFIIDPKVWIGELLSEEAEANYKDWKRRVESMSYLFDNEISFLENIDEQQLNDLFEIKDKQHPKIIRMFLQRQFSVETLIALNEIFGFLPRYDKVLSDPIYKEVSHLCKKYRPFLKYDRLKMKSLLKQKVGL